MTRIVRCLLVVLFAVFLSACDLGGSPQAPNAQQTGPGTIIQPKAPPVPPDLGEMPAPQDVTPEAIDVPERVPVLNEQAQITQYVKTMADIHVAATKARQVHEEPPQVTAIEGAVTCPTVPGQTGKLRQVGDTAKNTKAGKAMLVASCYRGKHRSIFFAPYKLYQFHMTHQPQDVQELIRRAMRDYLVGVTQDKAGNYDRLMAACSSGRMIGGLRDKGYIGQVAANTLEVTATDKSKYATIYRTARDTGGCPPRLFGRTS